MTTKIFAYLLGGIVSGMLWYAMPTSFMTGPLAFAAGYLLAQGVSGLYSLLSGRLAR